MGKLESICAGVNTLLFCRNIEGVLLDPGKVVLPEEYKGWVVEKAVYDPENDKIYVQVRYSNIVGVVVL